VPISSRALRSALTGKLGFSEDRSGPHPVYERWHQGQLVAITHMSHGRGEVSNRLLGAMARQVGIGGPQFRGAVSCAITGDEFLALVLSAS